jgi:PAS domain S-box-containing protein
MISVAVAVQAAYGVTALGSFGLGALLLSRRHRQELFLLGITTIGVALWSVAALAQSLANRFWYVPFHRLMHVGVLVSIIGLFAFALAYTGREQYLTRRTIGVAVAYGVVMMGLLLLNPGGLFLGELESIDTVGNYEYGWAPLFVVHAVVLYALVVGTILLMTEFVLRSTRRLYRGQAAALLGGTLVPAALNVAYLTGNFDLGITPLGLGVSVALFAFAAVRYRLGNVTPIAREKVLDTVRDGMLVVDTEGQVTDSNPAANWMIGVEDSPIGRPVSAVLADVPELRTAYEEMTAEAGESERTVTYGGQFIEVRATPITDDSGRQIGWTLLLQDVSERVRRERDLEAQVEKLDRFASIVSHDLRNPINVARGYIQQTQATGDLDNLDKSLDAVDRMDAIIEDVLALTRGGEEVTEPRPVSLQSLARETWGVVDTGAADLEVTDDTQIVADPDRLRRLLENLFRNSIEHGVEPTGDDKPFAAGHTVTVGVHEDEGTSVTVSVADNGVGIPPDRHEQVFEDGYTTGGTGLGLTIVEQIAGAHGWTVDLTDSPEGGASFELHGVGTPVRATQRGSED